MKKSKKLLMFVLSCIMVVSCLLFTINNSVYAAGEDRILYSRSINCYQFNPTELLDLYSENSTGEHQHSDYRYNGKGILVRSYDENGNLTTSDTSTDVWANAKYEANDSTNILALAQIYPTAALDEDDFMIESRQNLWNAIANEIIYSLAKDKNIPKDEITLTTSVSMDAVGDIEGSSYELDNKTKTIASTDAKIKQLSLANKNIIDAVNAEYGEGTMDDSTTNFRITVTLDTVNNGQWHLVLGRDNVFYLITTIPEFSTTMKYDDTPDDGTTYRPQYKENDLDKKDLDVVVTIKSETDEAIVSTNGVALTNDKTPNSEGWYYPDLEDKTVIAKTYKFDDYDNTTANGKVNETVDLVGEHRGEDTQKPSIEWTFRRKTITETENDDESVTFVITYNLPVDVESVPSDWSVIYDEDGKTVHKITKTVKKGEDYEKDVVVKQNGTDKTVSTPVKKLWNEDKTVAPEVLPQTGAFAVVFVAIVAGIAVFAITRYR